MDNTAVTPRDVLYKYYISMLKSALDRTIPPEPPAGVSFRQLYNYSASNHTAHMLREPLSMLASRPDPETDGLFMQQYAKSVSRDAEQKSAFDELVLLLTRESVSLLPIKGIELKSLYPAPGMRRMSDIDIVYDTRGNDEKVKHLMESLGYSCESWGGGHHDIFHRPPVMNIELHRRADYPGYFDAPCGLVPDNTVSGLFHLSPADFYIQLLRHDARHMKNGGLGIRAICDIYILRKHFGNALMTDYVLSQLDKYGLSRFAVKLNTIVRNLFETSDPVIDSAARVILSGYTYGNSTDSEMLRLTRAHKGSKILYALSRIFPGHGIMKNRYTIFNRFKVLLPVFWVVRWFEVLFHKKRRRNIGAMKKVIASTGDNLKQYEFITREFGLDCLK